MEVRHLELLRELADRGTLAAVAAATHRTPSAVSQQLRTAERELGLALVEPDSRGVRLTPAGQILAEGATEVAAALASVSARLEASTGQPRGPVSIAALPSAASVLLPELLQATDDSDLEIDITDVDVAETDFLAQAHDRDIVIAHSFEHRAFTDQAGVTVRTLATEPIDVALPSDHPLARRATLTPSDIVDEDWIGVPEGYPFDSVLVAAERLTGRTVRRRFRITDNDLAAAFVAAGQGLSLLPRFSTDPGDRFVLRTLTGVHAERHLLALSRDDRAARLAVRTVLDELQRIGSGLAVDDR
ncbi:MAG: LysR family transcriptional regulator [Propionibacteriales bacterium]|nr:LysR family transcriptional regulator [Propionibacteriales bacterium]